LKLLAAASSYAATAQQLSAASDQPALATNIVVAPLAMTARTLQTQTAAANIRLQRRAAALAATQIVPKLLAAAP
jgi:hypothetical protein